MYNPKTCLHCANVFIPKTGNAKFCNKKCLYRASYDPEKKREHYLRNQEAIKDKLYKHRRENPEKIKQQQSEYHARNKERRNAAAKEQRLQNLEKRRQYDRDRYNTPERQEWKKQWAQKTRERKNERERLRRKLNRDYFRDRDRTHKLRRKRLKVKNGHTPYKAKDIFSRDKYICHICRRKVLKTVKFPHPRYPTIDHVIPLSKGGVDAPLNVKTACYSCNASKNDKLLGQLSVFTSF